MKTWPKRNIFKDDVDKAGGLSKAANSAGFSEKTFREYYDGSRTPHWISMPGIAIGLGYESNRYQ